MDNSNNLERIDFLDGIRGWASVAVLYSHLIACFLAPKYVFLQSRAFVFVSDGNLAVNIFFVLSGMVLRLGISEQIILKSFSTFSSGAILAW